MELHYGIDLDCDCTDRATSAKLGFAGCDGNDPKPEMLLIAAISSSYGIALSNSLRAARLPLTRVSIRADGVVASTVGRTQFTRVTVLPTIRGADVLQRDAYERAATAARDDCLVGRSIRGNVAYVVGEVALLRSVE